MIEAAKGKFLENYEQQVKASEEAQNEQVGLKVVGSIGEARIAIGAPKILKCLER